VPADQISGQEAKPAQQDRILLVEVRIELDPTLLHQYTRKVFRRIERNATQVAAHALPPWYCG
jgi:hypothetical protein